MTAIMQHVTLLISLGNKSILCGFVLLFSVMIFHNNNNNIFLGSVRKEFLQDSACGIQHKESTDSDTLSSFERSSDAFKITFLVTSYCFQRLMV